MKKLAFRAALVACGALAGVLPAQAAKIIDCHATVDTDNPAKNPGFKSCRNSEAGKFDSLLKEIPKLEDTFGGSFYRFGLSTDGPAGSFGPFAAETRLSSGKLVFDDLPALAVLLAHPFILGFEAPDPGDLDPATRTPIEKTVFYMFDYTGLPAPRSIDFDTVGIDFRRPTLAVAALYFPVADGVPAVPEPGSWALALAGLGVLGITRRQRRSTT